MKQIKSGQFKKYFKGLAGLVSDKRYSRMANAILLFPVVFWFAWGMLKLVENGYNTEITFPFRVHTFSLLNMTLFYIALFTIMKSHRPLRNLSIAVSLIFLFNIVYEAIFALFYDWRGSIIALAVFLCGILLLIALSRVFGLSTTKNIEISILILFCVFLLSIFSASFFLLFLGILIDGIVFLIVLNRISDFLTTDKRKISLAILLFCGFFVSFVALNQTGFFVQLHLWHSGQTANNPHNLLWLVNKTLGLWGLFPLIEPRKTL